MCFGDLLISTKIFITINDFFVFMPIHPFRGKWMIWWSAEIIAKSSSNSNSNFPVREFDLHVIFKKNIVDQLLEPN